ncbi:DNA processing protein DprA [Anopheles sinensis]|uniref:DNA processing protein DprA n=1 Tax=Anopheles sinensis TaxID=74873 RepID=A0A084VJV1_ANOSI|nr:DNA processing protein DprA [Anopheles sinensis]
MASINQKVLIINIEPGLGGAVWDEDLKNPPGVASYGEISSTSLGETIGAGGFFLVSGYARTVDCSGLGMRYHIGHEKHDLRWWNFSPNLFWHRIGNRWDSVCRNEPRESIVGERTSEPSHEQSVRCGCGRLQTSPRALPCPAKCVPCDSDRFPIASGSGSVFLRSTRHRSFVPDTKCRQFRATVRRMLQIRKESCK